MIATYASASSYTRSGTGDDLQQWVGREFVIRAPFPVEASRIADFCAMLEDRNPAYWDTEAATRTYGRPIAPPATLTAWRWPVPWNPYGKPEHAFSATVEVPCPTDTLVNVEFSSEFLRPIMLGDRLTYVDRISAISAEKQTALGKGWFVTADTVVTNQDDAVVAKYRNVMLRYRSGTERPSAPKQESQRAAPAGQRGSAPGAKQVPRLAIPVTWTLCAQLTSATRDYFPGHHDPDYAREQGVSGPYPNTGYYCGLVDRVALEWADYDAVVQRRALRMFTPAPIGSTLQTSGTVLVHDTGPDGGRAELNIDVRSDGAQIAHAHIVLQLGVKK